MRSFDYIVIIYIAAISLMAVFFTVYDKRRAAKHKRRVSEKGLIIIAFLGGALPMYVTMKFIRHKTLHNKFMLGLPVIFLIQALLVKIILFFASK